MSDILTLKNPSFCIYLLSTSVLVLKMMALSLLTIYQRFQHKAFICEEDAKWLKGEVILNDKVERVRRACQNDLENIPIFLIIGLGYLWTQPPIWLAYTLYLGFIITRCLHSIVYTVFILPQPTRALLWGLGFVICGFMALRLAFYVIFAL